MPAKRAPKGKRSNNIHMCFDRILTGTAKVKAMQRAIAENPANGPKPSTKKLMGASSILAPAKMALIAGKKWKPGRTLAIHFLDGSKTQRDKVKIYAARWNAHCSINFDFGASKTKSDIRISFVADSGSWSYIGTDNLVIDKSEPTMNFGWLRDDTPDSEWERVVVHEFGHALGAIHEHQHPEVAIKWNVAKVYEVFSGPPNSWSKEEIDRNVLDKYSVKQTNASKYDPDSIMLYEFDGALIKGGKPTNSNKQLSKGDKAFIKKQYPAA